MITNVLKFGKFKGQRFCDTPKWYQEWANTQHGFLSRLSNVASEQAPPKKPTYLDGHSRKSQAFEDEQFQYEMNMADKYDPSDRYGHYEGI